MGYGRMWWERRWYVHSYIWVGKRAKDGWADDKIGKDRPREINQDEETLNWFGLREGRTKNELRRMVGGAGVKSIRCFKKVAEGEIKLQ
jgi:hypothetical protein